MDILTRPFSAHFLHRAGKFLRGGCRRCSTVGKPEPSQAGHFISVQTSFDSFVFIAVASFKIDAQASGEISGMQRMRRIATDPGFCPLDIPWDGIENWTSRSDRRRANRQRYATPRTT